MDWRRIAQWITGSLLLAALAAACGGDDADPRPTTSGTANNPSPTPSVAAQPTAIPDPEAEVLAAYERYWDVYAEALRDRDDSRLDEVMTGPRLDRAVAEIQDLRNQDYAVALVVNSRPVVVAIQDDEAMLMDAYENQSYRIDPETKAPLQPTPAPGPTQRDRVTLQRVGGAWKVVETVRQVSQ
ncbi:MAG: hypothetical protein L6Q80_10745 [Dehalococcoidia bacterium]|nr:hypothetical protein [Dehalococcoidia bacterium]